jgi:hypothetical protein
VRENEAKLDDFHSKIAKPKRLIFGGKGGEIRLKLAEFCLIFFSEMGQMLAEIGRNSVRFG